MLDKKGRLFGKVSIIDVLVVVIIIVMLAGAFVAYQKISGNEVLTENKGLIKTNAIDTLEVTVRVEDVRQMTVDAFAEGDEMFFNDTGKLMGEIKKVAKEPATKLIYDNNGKAVYAEIPQKYDVILTVHVPGKRLVNGFYTADNIQLAYGSELKIKTPTVETTAFLETITTISGE
ncbi:MAG: DUF4330 family protein [Clostridia bacterium]|nr:DUF4330 family protein [Clostridia bacterium]